MSGPLSLPPIGDPPEWIRKAAGVINALIRRVVTLETVQTGDVRYSGGVLQYWDGSAWQPVP